MFKSAVGRKGGTAPIVGSAERRYNPAIEVAMIQLTEQQVQELESPEAVPPRIVNPWTGETFVVLRVDEYG